jgi:ketosteroid isomerase-like protein
MDAGTTTDREAVRAEILRVDKEWAAAAASGTDLELALSFWSDDAAVFPPGAPAVVGKAAIREYVSGSFRMPGFSVWWETTDVTASPSGDLAYAVGRNRFTFPGPEGRPVTVHGKVVTVWRKDPTGWKCVIDIWNDDPKAAAGCTGLPPVWPGWQ